MKRFLVLLLLSIIVYFSNLGGSSIYVLDEAKNAGCAMEMDARNDVIVPTFNGELRTDKPPLHYFMMMMAFNTFDVTPFAARFFSAFCGVLLIGFLFWVIRNILNEHIAFLTGLVYLSSLQLGIQFHLAVPDPYLILLLTVCLLSFYIGLYKKPNYLYLTYISAALAFLTKGLIAFVFPALIIFIFLTITGQLNWPTIRRLKILRGVLLFLLIAAPWYWAVGNATHGEWLKGFFIAHNVNRFTSTMEGHGGFPLAAFVILYASLLPFSVFAFQACKMAIMKRKEFPLLLFSLVAVLTIAVFFSFSKTILPSYVGPATPFLAILIGYYLHIFIQKAKIGNDVYLSSAVALIITIAIPVAVNVALRQEKNLTSLSWLSLLFCVLPLGTIVGLVLLVRKNKKAFVYTWCCTWIIALMIFFYKAYPLVDERNPVTESLSIIHSNYPDHDIISYKTFNPAYVFALQHTIKQTASVDSVSNIALQKTKLIILTEKKYLNDLIRIPDLTVIYRGRDLFEGSETVVLAN